MPTRSPLRDDPPLAEQPVVARPCLIAQVWPRRGASTGAAVQSEKKQRRTWTPEGKAEICSPGSAVIDPFGSAHQSSRARLMPDTPGPFVADLAGRHAITTLKTGYAGPLTAMGARRARLPQASSSGSGCCSHKATTSIAKSAWTAGRRSAPTSPSGPSSSRPSLVSVPLDDSSPKTSAVARGEVETRHRSAPSAHDAVNRRRDRTEPEIGRHCCVGMSFASPGMPWLIRVKAIRAAAIGTGSFACMT